MKDLSAGKEVKAAVKFAIGELKQFEDACGVKIIKQKRQDKTHGELAVEVRFSVKEGINAFALGEVSGSVKNILSLAKKHLKYSLASRYHKEDNTFSLTVKLLDKELLEDTSRLLKVFQLLEFEGNAFISSKPPHFSEENVSSGNCEEDEKRRCLTFVSELSGKVNREFLRVVAGMGGSLPGTVQRAVILLMSLTSAAFTVKFDDLHDFYEHFVKDQELPKEASSVNWHTLRYVLEHALTDLFVKKTNLPQPILKCYTRMIKNLSGIASIRLVLPDDSELVFKFSNLDLFRVFPTIPFLEKAYNTKQELKEKNVS